jgi:DNA-directed RNA polymerase II subunit RPB7
MFFLKEMERIITLHPSFFGPRIHDYLSHQLLKDVEASNQGEYFIVCVLDGYEFSEGKVLPGVGFAEYTVHYRAIVWKPFRDEVVRMTCRQIHGIRG